jgi:hypothetical protein
MILFLDYDGVMHEIGCGNNALFRHAARFASVLRDFPQVSVVVTSDWRKEFAFPELVSYFDLDIQNRFIGMTSVDSNPRKLRVREKQCWAWLCEQSREHEHWIAIDDCPDNFGPDRPGCGSVLFTDPSVGLDDEASVALRMLINNQIPTTHFCYDRKYLRGWLLWDGM